MRKAWCAVGVLLALCLVIGYACCRGLQDPITVAVYHLCAYWACLLASGLGAIELLRAIERWRTRPRPRERSPFDVHW